MMKILQLNNMGARLGYDHSATNHFNAIIGSRPDIDLTVMRDSTLKSLPELQVVTLPRMIAALPAPFRITYRLVRSIVEIHRRRIDFVHGICLSPQIYTAWIAALLTRRKLGATLVAGIREVYLSGEMMARLALFVLRRTDVVAVTGEKTRSELVKSGLDPERVVVVNNVTDVKRFTPDPDRRKDYDIVSTNRLYPVKNLETMLEAIALVREKKPDLRVAMGGDGPEMEKLQKLSATLGLEDCVDFLGFLETDEVARVLNSGRIFALTSRAEGLPISVLEAMACGLPCVVSNVGDMLNVARHDWNGFIIEDCRDAKAFADAFLQILENPDVEERLSKNALEVRSTHSVEAVAMTWKRILNQLEKGEPPGSAE
jgi:glycosyltransferase involved in cell wall biosynthesis